MHPILQRGERVMDAAYLSAFAALAGSVIGGLTSLAASWLTQRVQFRAQQLAQDLSRREELYKDFIEEASKWYADAYGHDNAEISNLVKLYALVSGMRILSSPKVVENADRVVGLIIETYLAPNKSLRDLQEIVNSGMIDPLRDFSNAYREELRDTDLYSGCGHSIPGLLSIADETEKQDPNRHEWVKKCCENAEVGDKKYFVSSYTDLFLTKGG